MTDALATALPQLAPASIRHRVLAALRAAIVGGQLKPGQRLTEEQICSQMAVSRGPVREAMRELELEGLIISTPYKGAEVLDISDREVIELLMPLRLALEEFGFRCALENATSSDLGLLEGILKRMARAAKQDDVDGVIAADTDFHEAVLKISGQVHCLRIWRTISPRVRAYFARWQHQNPDLEYELQSHRQLLESFRARDLPTLLARLRRHIVSEPIAQYAKATRHASRAPRVSTVKGARRRSATARRRKAS